MAYGGQILDNAISGERFIFHRTAEDTGGELLAVELMVAPDGKVPGAHVHPVQEERFEVVSGAMGSGRAGKPSSVGRGTPWSFLQGPPTGSPTPATARR
jgi:hypothetical protein